MGRPFTEQLTQGQSLTVGTTGPTVLNGTSVATAGQNMGKGPKRVRAFFTFGTVNASSLLTLAIQASAALASGYANITTEPTTQPTITGLLGVAGQVATIEIRADQLPAGKPFVRAIATETGNQNVTVDVILIGDCGEYNPNNAYDNVTYATPAVVAA